VSSIILRDYQGTDLSKIVANMKRGVRRQVYVLPTGGGKTAIASYMLEGSHKREQSGWFVVHRRELAYQTGKAFRKYGIPHGLVMADEPMHPWHHVQIILIGSLMSRLKYLQPPKLIIPDECHHARAATWDKMLDMFPQAWNVGLTATPQRLDGKGLGKHYDAMVVGPEMRWLIERGYLSDYRLFMPPPPVLDDVKITAGDYDKAALAEALKKSTIVGDAIREYKKHCDHQRLLIRCVDVAFSIEVAQKFRDAGYRAAHVDGMSNKHYRRDTFDHFASGELEVMTQVDIAGEGVDIPGIQAVSDLAPTKSLTKAKQFWGRALRMYEGKQPASILDHAGNALRHGFPDDVVEWSLDDVKHKKVSPPIFTCPACFAAFREKHKVCPECGTVMYDPAFAGGRGRPDQKDGTLHEITPEEREKKRAKDAASQDEYKARNLRKRELRELQTLKDYEEYGAAKGYKPGWAKHVFEAKQKTIAKYSNRRGYVE
jgi:superfamily II DNA or RNA helicase